MRPAENGQSQSFGLYEVRSDLKCVGGKAIHYIFQRNFIKDYVVTDFKAIHFSFLRFLDCRSGA
ncbi:hypothetical protein EMIT0347P_110053 [Pseudomonas sp. IT-347P]